MIRPQVSRGQQHYLKASAPRTGKTWPQVRVAGSCWDNTMITADHWPQSLISQWCEVRIQSSSGENMQTWAVWHCHVRTNQIFKLSSNNMSIKTLWPVIIVPVPDMRHESDLRPGTPWLVSSSLMSDPSLENSCLNPSLARDVTDLLIIIVITQLCQVSTAPAMISSHLHNDQETVNHLNSVNIHKYKSLLQILRGGCLQINFEIEKVVWSLCF